MFVTKAIKVLWEKINKEVNERKEGYYDNRRYIVNVDEKTYTLNTRVGNAETSIARVETRATNLESKTKDLDRNIDILYDGYENTAKRLQSVEEQANVNLPTTITNVTSRVATNETNISNLSKRETTSENNIKNITTRVVQTENNVTNLTTRMNDIDGSEGRVSNIEKTINGLSAEIDSKSPLGHTHIQSEISGLQSVLEYYDEAIPKTLDDAKAYTDEKVADKVTLSAFQGLGNYVTQIDQRKLEKPGAFTEIQVVDALPSSPSGYVLYLVREAQ